MARHFVHSLVLTAVLSPLVNAGPCRPSSSSTLTATVATTTKESTSVESLSTLLTSTIVESETTGSATSLEATTTTTSCSTQPFPWEISSSVTTTTSEESIATTTTTETAATTTAAEEPFECQNNLKVPAPANAACGISGYRPSVPQGAKAIGYGSVESLSACYQSCMEKANCVTFAFMENSFCDLWKGAVGETDGSETDFKWYETRCFCDTGIEPAPTCEDTNIIKNAGWDTGKFSPWKYYSVAEDRDIVDFSIKAGGADGTGYRFQTGNFHYDKSMWLYQDLTACPGITLQCSFKWMWDKYYGIAQDNGDTLVPYVRIYQDNASRAHVSEYPRSSADTQRWIESDSFYFTIPASGKTRIWYVASSPQGEWINTSTEPYKSNWVHRTNKLALDSLICNPV